MISSIEWVPAGVADPNPKKYEFSQAELDLIEMMEKHNMGEVPNEDAMNLGKKKTKTKLPKIENNLPADLRMDEYSSDEEDNEAARGAAIGRLLVEDNESLDESNEAVPEAPKSPADSDDDDDDSDDDDLADVPDTREYMPVDIDGLNSIGFSQVGTNAPAYMGEDDSDDESDADDVRLRSSDAIVVVAKTEEVSLTDFSAIRVVVFEHVVDTRFSINCY